MKQPHIIIFNPDQFRTDGLSHVGRNAAAATPNLDALVRTDGVSFSNAFCQNPVCTPSRCSFMSGWYPHVRGHRTMYHMMQEDEPVLLRVLKNNGYFVWWGGKNDLIPGQRSSASCCDIRYKAADTHGHRKRSLWDMEHAERWRGKPGSDTYYTFHVGKLDKGDDSIYYDHDWEQVLGAVDMIEHAPKDKPLCIYLPLIYPHPPYAVEDPWYSMIDRSKVLPRIPAPAWEKKPSILRGIYEMQGMRSWTEERFTELRAVYYGMCARIDHQFGLIVDALERAGIYDDTAIFFFSDHGDFTGDYGLVEKTQNTFEDCLTNVPFIIKPPSGTAVSPRVCTALTELVDLPATVFDMTGIAPGYTHFGRSLLPCISGKTDTHRDAVFCEGGRLHGETHCMERNSTSFNNPNGLYYPRTLMQQSEGPEHTKAVMCRTASHKYVRRLYEPDELYDLRTDPSESCNRIDDASSSSVTAAMKERMLTFFLETGDAVPHTADER